SGGTAGKLPGRVGDSALIGCGTYAESTLGGVSCTGEGEAIIRVALARRTLEILKAVDDPAHACEVALSVLVDEGRGQGGLVVAASAGNHALAVAWHATRLGIAAVVVMPEWAPLGKVMSARRQGAEVILHGENYDEAFARAKEIEAERDLVFVHPFDDPRVIAGQGTIGLELLEQVAGLDAVLVPVGGGGLIGGIALAVKSLQPAVRVVGVQAEEMAGMKAALAAGQRVMVPAASTISDGIAVRRVGDHTFDLARRHVD